VEEHSSRNNGIQHGTTSKDRFLSIGPNRVRSWRSRTGDSFKGANYLRVRRGYLSDFIDDLRYIHRGIRKN